MLQIPPPTSRAPFFSSYLFFVYFCVFRWVLGCFVVRTTIDPEPHQQATLKGLYPKGLTLLGFRPEKSLRADYNVRSPYFLYPDEESTVG